MKRHLWLLLIAAIFVSCGTQTDVISEFQKPSAEYRPHVRMWIPQAAVEENTLRAQIQDLAHAGFGDVELVAFGIGRGRSGQASAIDESIYGWGTEKWSETMQIVLDEAGKNGIKATFTIGPAWPIATPLLEKDSEGVEIQLACDRTDLTENTYKGNIAEDYFAVVAGKRKTKDISSPIEMSSLSDITGLVSTDSKEHKLKWTAPDDSGCWSIFVYRNEKVGEMKNGFYVVDHFSLAGTQAVIDYYQEVFDELEDKGLLKYLSGLFGDSLEYTASVDWTLGFAETFQSLKGYDIIPYLPAIHNGVEIGGGGIFGGGFGKEALDGAGDRILNDYYDVVTYLFNHNHLKPMQDFLEEYGMNLRYQTAYGKYMEQASTSMFAGIPEGELMMIRNSFDNIRAQAGAVHMAGLKEYNAELQAEMSKNHAQSWQNLLFFVQRAYSAGVNNITLHGYNYNGRFDGPGNIEGHLPGVAWPGWEGFGRDGFSNSWGAEPLWEMAPVYTGFIARNGFILKQGTPKIDLAVFRESYWDNNFEGRDGDYWYKDSAVLQDMGYSYDFVSLTNLALPTAIVRKGVLAPEGPAYKALILDQTLNTRNEPVEEKTIALKSAEKILELAKGGLPVIYISDLPMKSSFFGEQLESGKLKDLMNELASLPNVRRAADFDDVPSVLTSMNILPDAAFHQNPDDERFINIHRKDDETDYFFIYNRGYNTNSGNQFPWGWSQERELPYGAAEAEVTFRATGTPYILNAWDGSVVPVTDYTENNGTITVPIYLQGNESIIIAIDRSGRIKPTCKAYIKDYSQTENIDVTDWNLVVESWEPGSLPTETKKSAIEVALDSLEPWSEIDELDGVSGIGTYTASFTLDKGWEEGTGAYIDLGTVNYSYRLWINDTEITANQIDTKVDIGRWVKAGVNNVKVEVATTLNNRIKHLSDRSRRTTDPYGLIGKDGRIIISTYTVQK